MNITVDIKTLLLMLVLVAIIVLIIYAIVMIRKLLATLERTNEILDDVKVVSDIAANRSKDIDGLVDDVTGSITTISDSIKGNGDATNACVSVINTITSLMGFFSKHSKK